MFLQSLKCFVAVLVPGEVFLLPSESLMKGFGYGGVMLNKTAVIISRAEKLPQLFGILRGRVVSYHCYL